MRGAGSGVGSHARAISPRKGPEPRGPARSCLPSPVCGGCCGPSGDTEAVSLSGWPCARPARPPSPGHCLCPLLAPAAGRPLCAPRVIQQAAAMPGPGFSPKFSPRVTVTAENRAHRTWDSHSLLLTHPKPNRKAQTRPDSPREGGSSPPPVCGQEGPRGGAKLAPPCRSPAGRMQDKASQSLWSPRMREALGPHLKLSQGRVPGAVCRPLSCSCVHLGSGSPLSRGQARSPLHRGRRARAA